jgi:hypothetical protein
VTTSLATNPLATGLFPAPAEPAATAEPWTLVVHLAPSRGTSGPLKVLSVLHTRQVSVSHMQYVAAPDGSAVMTFECTTHVASIETVRKSVENAVVVTSASAHEAPR